MLTTRSMIMLSAFAAAGIVLLSDSSHSGQTAGLDTMKLQDRHPAFSVGDDLRRALDGERSGQTQPAPVSTPKQDRLDLAGIDCDRYTWPKIPTYCLTFAEGETIGQAVTVEARLSERVSIVTPTPTIVAQR